MLLEALFQAIDRRDTDAFCEFLSDDCRFRFGNLPAMIGKDNVAHFVGDFFASIAAVSHDIHAHWTQPDSITCHGMVSYTRKDGTQLTVPFANILTIRTGRIDDYLIFVDASQLFAQA